MPWTRPTLTQLRQLARGMFAARLPGADAALRRSNIAVTSDVLAGMTNGEYGYLDYLIRQNFADTADGDYLLRIGSMFGMAPIPGTKAAGNAVVTGIDGNNVPNSLTLFQDNNGNTYRTTALATIAGGTATVPIEASEGGTAQNLDAGAQLELTTALAGIDANAVVDGAGLTGGTNSEDVKTSFRTRVLARLAQPPQGGNYADYIAWAKTVPGVTRAWVYPANRGGGTVDVTFVMDGRANIIPLVADINAVQAAINAKRPVSDDCLVFAPVATLVNFHITGVTDPVVQQSIQNSVSDMFTADTQAGGAYNPATGGTYSGGLSFQDQIDPAVAAGAGDTPFVIVAPVADVTCLTGHILVPGAYTWV